MMEESENVADYRNMSTPRKFGTDLSTSMLANHSAKRVVRVRKSATKKKRISDAHAATGPSTLKPSNADKASALTYSVHFEPGPVGLKLEPVVTNMGAGIGCRVLEFADGGDGDPGQARKSTKIRPGDLLTDIDGHDVVSWNYPDIIALLKRNPGSKGRDVVFRSVWNSVCNSSEQKPVPLYAQTQLEEAPATPLKQCELMMDDTSMEEFTLMQSPTEALLHSHFLSCFDDGEKSEGRQSDEHELHVSKLSSDPKGEDKENNDPPTIASHILASDTKEDDSLLSPSRVKALSEVGRDSGVKGSSSTSQKSSSVIRTVYRTVAPTAGVVVSGSYSLTSAVTSAMSMKLGEVLVGHKSKDFDHAVQLKMQLLAELSQAKVTIDRQLDEHKRLEEVGQQLAKERDTEREVRENLEKELHLYQEEKTALELQLDSSKRLITDISQQLATEQQKLRNSLKDSDSKVKAFEATIASLSAQAEQDRHERNILNCTIENLHAELKDKDAVLNATESTLGSVKEDARVAQEDLRRSLESAIQARNASSIRLRDLEKQRDETNAKLSIAESRLSESADECRRIERGRAEALEEVSRLETSATANDQARSRLDNELANSRSKLLEVEQQLARKSEEGENKVSESGKKLAELNAELEKLQASIASLRRELGEKDTVLQNAVDASSFLQAELQTSAGLISELKATLEDSEQQKMRVTGDLKAAENGMEQLRTQIFEKDSKLAALDMQLCEMGACLEAMKEKLNEKVTALTLATDREKSLRDNHDTLLRRISEFESAFENADHERRLAEEKNRRTESELSNVVEQMTLLRPKLNRIDTSRNEAREEIKNLKQSEKTLIACTEKLRLDLEQSETMLAASGINLLSKDTTIDELRSSLVTNDVTIGRMTEELDSLRAKHDGVVAKATRLEMKNSQLVICNEKLRLDLEQSEAKLAASGLSLLSKNATIDELHSFIALKDITAGSKATEPDSVLANYNQLLAHATGLETANSELLAENETLRNELRSAKNELSASYDQANSIESSLAEFSSAKAELVARLEFVETSVIDTKKKLSSSQMEALQHKQEVVRLRDQLSKNLDASAMADTTLMKEHDEVVKALKVKVNDTHRLVKDLEPGDKSSLSSDCRQSLQQLSLLSDELAFEKENDSEFKRSRDEACEVSQRLHSEITKDQEVHKKDFEHMFEDRETAVGKLGVESDSRVKDLQSSLTQSQREQEELRSNFQRAKQDKEEILDLLVTSQAESEQELAERLFQKEEEIVSRDIRLQELQHCLDAEEKSSAEVHLGFKILEKKLAMAESREAKAIVEARTFSRRLKAMEDDMYAMAREIEMLINTNEVMEERLIEMKAARSAAEAEAGTNGAVAYAHEKISVDLKTKLEEQVDRNQVLQRDNASLSSCIDQFRIEKENAEAEIVDVERSLEEAHFALRTSADIVKGKDNELHQMRMRLGEMDEKRVTLERKLREMNDNTVELNDRLEKVHRDSQREIKKLQGRVEELRKDNDEKDAAFCSQRHELARLTDELETQSQKLLSVAAARAEAVSMANELRNSLEASADIVQGRDDELQLMKENLNQINEKRVHVERELRKSIDHASELKAELDKAHQGSQQLRSRVEHLQKDIEGNDATLRSQQQDLVRLSNELGSQRQELLSVTALRAAAVSEVHDLRTRLESTESLQEELRISQDIGAKLEVSNRTLIRRVAQLEAAHEQTLNDLAETETSLSCTTQLSKDLEHQVLERQVEGDRLRTQVQLLQSTQSRIKSERVLQEEAAQELEGQIVRTAELKHEREVASLRTDNEEKGRMLVELAAKLTARSRLIAHYKMFEQTLIGFIEKLVDRTDSLLVGVSGQALKLKMMANNEVNKSMEALDLACGNAVSSVSCNELFHIVSNARIDFDECKQELQHLKRGVGAGANSHPSTPPATPEHAALSLNLSKMKKMVDEYDDCRSPLMTHQATLRTMVDYVELQIDSLISDLFAARRAIESKDEAFSELESLVANKESQKESLHKNLKSLQIYVKQLQKKLHQDRPMDEVNHQDRSMDEANHQEMKKAAVQIICNTLERRGTASAGQAFRKWSGNTSSTAAVDQQRNVAEALGKQLDVTREKLAILKSHLKRSTRSSIVSRSTE